MSDEIALCFAVEDARLVGVVHRPARPAPIGVLIVVGGPQYRIGSHRQYVLLARALAAAGVAVMRFDYRGMGDSDGEHRGFEAIDADIAAAIDAFMNAVPGLGSVALFGLCDGASAAAFYGGCDARVGGLVLVNPWVRSEAGLARAYLRHYYVERLFSAGFWRKLIGGRLHPRTAIAAMLGHVRRARAPCGATDPAQCVPGEDLAERLLEGLARFHGRVLVVLSGVDLVAREFEDAMRSRRPWRRLARAQRFEMRRLDGADHTFSRAQWRDQVVAWTRAWLAAT